MCDQRKTKKKLFLATMTVDQKIVKEKEKMKKKEMKSNF